jgi:hypothetical protein
MANNELQKRDQRDDARAVIEKPVIGILDITMAEHHAIRALSNSGMRDLAVSPLRYWYQNINPAPAVEEEESKALRMGSALHCAVLESEETFESRYVRELDPSDWPVCLDTVKDIRDWVADKGGKCKGVVKDEVIASALAFMRETGDSVPILADEQKRFFALHGHKTVLKVEEWERIAGMARALAEEPALRPILAKGKAEVSIVAEDPETGVLLKARLDWMAPRFILDLKTFTQKRGVSIDKSIGDAIYYERYWVQAYFYDYVRRLATGEKAGEFDFVFAFVESDQPHETRIKSLLPKIGGNVNLFWETARHEVQARIRQYANYLSKYGDNPWRDPQKIENLTDADVRQFAY